MSLLLGIILPEKGLKAFKKVSFIAYSKSPCYLKGGFEFYLLPKVPQVSFRSCDAVIRYRCLY